MRRAFDLDTGRGVAATTVAGLAVLAIATFLLVYTVTWVDAAYQDRQCARFEKVTGRTTQFRQFSHWSYGCYAQTGDGTWLPIGQLRDI